MDLTRDGSARMEGQTILCVETRIWRSMWRDGQQIMSRLAADNRVIVFEPGRNPDRRHSTEMLRNFPNFLSLHPERLHDNLILVPTPSCLPYAARHMPRPVLQVTAPWVARLNSWILIRQIRWAMRALDVQDPILWLYDPRQTDLLGKFGEKLACYFNYDEQADFAHNHRIRDLFRRYDDEMSRRADVVFSTSRGQWERRRRLNPQTYFLPNGVNFDLFHRALDAGTQVPADIAALPRPIIGLMGWLGYQVDADLLVRVAEAFPTGSVVLVGPDALPSGPARSRLHALSNVHFTGQKELEELPAYLKAFDVATIPYVIGGHTLTVYPLKLHEYLAGGRPIVATALPELRHFPDVVRIGHTYEDFIAQIETSLRYDSPAAVAARVAVARENTWDRRVDDIRRVLRDRLSMARGGQVEERSHLLDQLSA